jgi:hypothetical protein
MDNTYITIGCNEPLQNFHVLTIQPHHPRQWLVAIFYYLLTLMTMRNSNFTLGHTNTWTDDPDPLAADSFNWQTILITYLDLIRHQRILWTSDVQWVSILYSSWLWSGNLTYYLLLIIVPGALEKLISAPFMIMSCPILWMTIWWVLPDYHYGLESLLTCFLL